MIKLDKLNSKFSKNIILEEQPNGCIKCVSHCSDNCGYTRIKYKGKHERLFRVIYMLKYGEIPKGMVIRHKCDNSYCCNIEHLEIGTPKDNVNDMIKRGRSGYHKMKNFGEKNGSSKLSKNEVKNIYLSELSNYELSKKYNVSKVTIYNIKNKKYWKWFTDTLD